MLIEIILSVFSFSSSMKIVDYTNNAEIGVGWLNLLGMLPTNFIHFGVLLAIKTKEERLPFPLLFYDPWERLICASRPEDCIVLFYEATTWFRASYT